MYYVGKRDAPSCTLSIKTPLNKVYPWKWLENKGDPYRYAINIYWKIQQKSFYIDRLLSIVYQEQTHFDVRLLYKRDTNFLNA